MIFKYASAHFRSYVHFHEHEHEHSLDLIDLWSEQLQSEEEYEEEEEESEDALNAKQDFQRLCLRCEEEINWFHRYYYTCGECNSSIHKYCAELLEKMEHICQVDHTLYKIRQNFSWSCNICHRPHSSNALCYFCAECNFEVDANCATKNIIYHPSHVHPLVDITKQLIYECDACGKEHKGIFYQCLTCNNSLIHSHCAFLPKKLRIQNTTNDLFSHVHLLSLAYSFPRAEQESKNDPRCRVCLKKFDPRLWIYKCEKCRYYAHLDCATSRKEPFMSILTSPGTGKTIKNYEDVKHPNLVHLPFPDPSYSILKHLFFKKDVSSTFEINKVTKTHISHQHPLLLLEDAHEGITSSTSSRKNSISFHDPMKRIELLCDGCLRPITTTPIYMCANDQEDINCNFVLHEWCSRLPTKLKNHYAHPQHTLILHSKISSKFFGVFYCNICELHCNGFAYCCDECNYCIDVNCAFLPEEITHTSHSNHLLSRGYPTGFTFDKCRMCGGYIWSSTCSFSCHTCDEFKIHVGCALLIPETTTHMCDKHPMKLSYFPIENHKSEYFCEICEEGLNPEYSFYHCHKCMQSIHIACASSILRYETYASPYANRSCNHKNVNVKFGGTYNNFEMHPHPLSFVQGIASDGNCVRCGRRLQYKMIFKCLNCEFAIHYSCW